MSKRKIIGFVGPAGCGKTTLTDKLVSEWDFGIKFSFTDKLRRMVADAFEINYYDLVKNKNDFAMPAIKWEGERLTNRRLMQVFGQIMRKLEPKVWVRPLYMFVEQVSPHYSIVVDDVRFENEAEAIHELGGKIVKLTRPGYELQGQAATDVSERFEGIPIDEYWNNTDLESIKNVTE